MRKTILKKIISGIKLTSFSAALACAFLCGNKAQCVHAGNDDASLAQSLRDAFDPEKRNSLPIDVVIVVNSCFAAHRLDNTILIFACLAVNLGAKPDVVKRKLGQTIDSLMYDPELPNISDFLQRISAHQWKSEKKKLLETFDDYCAQLQDADSNRKSWKIVVFDGWNWPGPLMTRPETDKIRQIFFELVSPERVLVYFRSSYKDTIQIDKSVIKHICTVIDEDLQNWARHGQSYMSKLQFNVPNRSPLERDVRSRILENAYKKYLKCLNLYQEHNTFFNRSFVWYNNEQLCHYDNPLCPGEWDNLFVDLESGDVKKDAYICYLGKGKDVADSSRYNQLGKAVLDNICTRMFAQQILEMQKQKEWSNNCAPSKLCIFFGENAINGERNRTDDNIVTVYTSLSCDSGVARRGKVFPRMASGFSLGDCRLDIVTVENIFPKDAL